jgi:putative toxin-antitoxin system antitoxin component (TIGR02293 family)
MDFEKSKKSAKKLVAVNEAVEAYVSSIDSKHKFLKSRGRVSLSHFLNDKMLLIYAIRQGITYSLFSEIQSITPFNEEEWAEHLNISTKSLQRYRKAAHHVFKPGHSEKIIELLEVVHLGSQVFDTTDQFYTWLHSPSMALGGQKPAELVKDSYGKEMVMDELNRIEYGVFA